MLPTKNALQEIFLLHIYIFTSWKQLNCKFHYQKKHQDIAEMHNYVIAW